MSINTAKISFIYKKISAISNFLTKENMCVLYIYFLYYIYIKYNIIYIS